MPDTRIVLQQEMSYELKDKTLKMMIQRGGGTSVGRLGSWPSKVPRYVKKKKMDKNRGRNLRTFHSLRAFIVELIKIN